MHDASRDPSAGAVSPGGGGVIDVLRRALREIPALRSARHLVPNLIAVLRPETAYRNEIDRAYDGSDDPWGCNSAWGPEYHERALAILHPALGAAHAARVVEVGCGDGTFTALLAQRSAAVLALDVADAALARARQRLRSVENVEVARWDLHHDGSLGAFDLVVCMVVLDYVRRPSQMARAREKLVEMVRPGGHLLVSCWKQNDAVEAAWWARHLIRGARPICSFVAGHPSLELVSEDDQPLYLHALLRRSS